MSSYFGLRRFGCQQSPVRYLSQVFDFPEDQCWAVLLPSLCSHSLTWHAKVPYSVMCPTVEILASRYWLWETWPRFHLGCSLQATLVPGLVHVETAERGCQRTDRRSRAENGCRLAAIGDVDTLRDDLKVTVSSIDPISIIVRATRRSRHMVQRRSRTTPMLSLINLIRQSASCIVVGLRAYSIGRQPRACGTVRRWTWIWQVTPGCVLAFPGARHPQCLPM